ncbi:MAG: DNA-directed RNA polymerase subunit omega [Planctomycetota bacterium]
MIEALKSDDLARKVGGQFRLTAIIQRRWAQLMEGARPLVDRGDRTDLELIIEEIRQGKIDYAIVDEEAADGANKARPTL